MQSDKHGSTLTSPAKVQHTRVRRAARVSFTTHGLLPFSIFDFPLKKRKYAKTEQSRPEQPRPQQPPEPHADPRQRGRHIPQDFGRDFMERKKGSRGLEPALARHS